MTQLQSLTEPHVDTFEIVEGDAYTFQYEYRAHYWDGQAASLTDLGPTSFSLRDNRASFDSSFVGKFVVNPVDGRQATITAQTTRELTYDKVLGILAGENYIVHGGAAADFTGAVGEAIVRDELDREKTRLTVTVIDGPAARWQLWISPGQSKLITGANIALPAKYYYVAHTFRLVGGAVVTPVVSRIRSLRK